MEFRVGKVNHCSTYRMCLSHMVIIGTDTRLALILKWIQLGTNRFYRALLKKRSKDGLLMHGGRKWQQAYIYKVLQDAITLQPGPTVGLWCSSMQEHKCVPCVTLTFMLAVFILHNFVHFMANYLFYLHHVWLIHLLTFLKELNFISNFWK